MGKDNTTRKSDVNVGMGSSNIAEPTKNKQNMMKIMGTNG